VLDLTCEGQPFGFDAASIVAMYATTIENQLLRAQSTEHLVVRLQTSPGLIGTPMEGLAGIDPHGRIAWLNNVAARLLGIAQGPSGRDAHEILGLDTRHLAALTRAGASVAHRLPNGLNVWLSARMQARDGVSQPVFQLAQAPAPTVTTAVATSTLRDNDRELISRTVRACDGNVSKAARQLGVSRGLVYRHLKKTASKE